MLLRNRHSLWLRLGLALGAMALFLLGYQWGNQYQHSDDEPTRINGVLVRPVGTIPALSLHDPLGQTFDKKDLSGRWTLMAVGDLTQASGQRAVQRLIDAYNRVADQPPLRRSLQLILIAVPDSPGLARDFDRLSPALHVLSGDDEEVARIKAALGLSDAPEPTLFLFGPDANLIALLPASETGSEVAEDLKAVYADPAALHPEQP